MILTGFWYNETRSYYAIANKTFVEGKHSQLWKIGQPDKEGYYTIQNFESQKLISNAERISGHKINFFLNGKYIA